MVSCVDEFCKCLFFVQRLDLFVLSKHRKQKVNSCLKEFTTLKEKSRWIGKSERML